MHKSILFVDISCPKPYDGESHYSQAQGGTESTIARIAEGLANKDIKTIVSQHCRSESIKQGVQYMPLDESIQATHVIALRTPKLIPWMQKHWPKAKHYLWLHDENYNDLLEAANLLRGVKLICVSRYHKTKLLDVFLSHKMTQRLDSCFIYNPLDKSISGVVTSPTRDPNKFIFFSSPHKGLTNTLTQFQAIHQLYPQSKLYIANPGYYPSNTSEAEYLVNLGELSYPEAMKHVAESQAVIHLQTNFPETFGLVHAEANHIGIPVLTSGLGANREVLNPASAQIIDVHGTEAIVKRIEKWKIQGYPVVKGNPAFLLENIIPQWENLFRD